MSMLERLPEPYGYHTLIDTLWAREAEGRRKMVRTRRWKYVTDPSLASGSGAQADDELYDLENDPWELRNIAQDPRNAEVIAEMKALLLSWMAETEDPRPVPLPPTVGRSTDTPSERH
jgi:arylsulfatase A-like enzyme